MMIIKGYYIVEANYLCCGLLHRKVFDGQLQESKFQFVLPKPYWKQSLEACHDNMGHLGIKRTTSLRRDQFYWPSMIEVY